MVVHQTRKIVFDHFSKPTKKRVENTKRSGAFLTNFEKCGQTWSRVFDISSKIKEKTEIKNL